MATSRKEAFRIAPRQRLQVKPITHSVEQAALDERIKSIPDLDSEPIVNGSRAEASRRRRKRRRT